MTKRKYTIEASIRTLARFIRLVDTSGAITDSFVHSLTTSRGDEYHYVTVTATAQVHSALRTQGYRSKAMSG